MSGKIKTMKKEVKRTMGVVAMCVSCGGMVVSGIAAIFDIIASFIGM